jgi:tetratricopeptide (TPR) repeat protein
MKLYVLMLATVLVATSGVSRADTWSQSHELEAAGRFADAAKLFDPLLREEPDNEFARLRRAWLHYLAGEYNASQGDYKRALQANPRSLDAQIGLTLPLLAQQRWREAAIIARQALKVAPWNYYAHLRLLAAEEGERQWQTLREHSDQLHQRYPGDATILVYRARAHYWLGNMKEARHDYLQVLQRVPGHIEAGRFLASPP